MMRTGPRDGYLVLRGRDGSPFRPQLSRVEDREAGFHRDSSIWGGRRRDTAAAVRNALAAGDPSARRVHLGQTPRPRSRTADFPPGVRSVVRRKPLGAERPFVSGREGPTSAYSRSPRSNSAWSRPASSPTSSDSSSTRLL